MLDHLHRMAVFQAVAEAGSFRGGAKRLGLSPSVVSHHVSQLEAQLGLALFYRTTRRLSLSDAGRELLVSARRMTEAADAGLAAMQVRREQPVGHLKVTVPAGAQHPSFGVDIASFLKRYPGITLDMSYSDAYADLAGSDIDLAFRGGPGELADMSYRAKPYSSDAIWLAASADYVADRRRPETLADLSDWDWIEYPPGLTLAKFLLDPAALHGVRPPRTRLTVDSMFVAEEAALGGVGIVAIPWRVVAPAVRSGRLVRLLPDLPLRPITTHAVWPANAGADSPIRLLLDYLGKIPDRFDPADGVKD